VSFHGQKRNTQTYRFKQEETLFSNIVFVETNNLRDVFQYLTNEEMLLYTAFLNILSKFLILEQSNKLTTIKEISTFFFNFTLSFQNLLNSNQVSIQDLNFSVLESSCKTIEMKQPQFAFSLVLDKQNFETFMIKNQSYYCLNVELTSKSSEDGLNEELSKEEDNMLVVRTNELAEDLLIFSVH
jgi:hypothetical protein